jgi:hypothetical protein
MAIGRSVQFYGIDKALQAYDNQEVPAWGLFQGGQFLAKYDGPDMNAGGELLKQFLLSIETGYNGNANTTYTLCVYESLKGEKITSKTPFSGSFNFQLVERMQAHGANMQSQAEQIGKIIDERLAAHGIGGVDDNEEDEEPAGPWAAIGKMLEHPQIREAIATRAIGLMDRFLGSSSSPGQSYQQAPAAAMGAVTMSQEEIDRCNQAIQMLAAVDPELGSHLMRLAEVATVDPAKYKNLISMLSLL